MKKNNARANDTRDNINKHMRHASNGIQSNITLQNLDKNNFVTNQRLTESKAFDDNAVKPIKLFASHNKLINYCNSIGLIKLKDSTNPSSQKLFKYSEKLLKTSNKELKGKIAVFNNKSLNLKEQNSLIKEIDSLKALNNFLEVITNSFPDITYGLGALKDCGLHLDNIKFLSLAINTYYNRVFSSSAFVQHLLHKASNEEKQEFLDFNQEFRLIPKNIDVNSIKMQESYPKEVVEQKLQELKAKFSEELKEKYIKDEFLLNDLDNILELKEFKIKSQEEFKSLKIQHKNELLQITQKKEKEKDILIKELSKNHQEVELELKNKITSVENKLQEKETKIYELEIGAKISKENYDQMTLELATLNKEFDIKADELTIKEKEVASIKREFNLVKINKDGLEKQLAAFERAKKSGFEATANEDLGAEVKLGDSDDESEEDNIYSSKPTDKEKDKTDLIDDLPYLKDNKENIELITTTTNYNYTANNEHQVTVNGELSDTD